MAIIGKHILDNLTTGMYADSRVIYREYIQNACDQINKAIKLGIISPQESEVTIFIDEQRRYIKIRDNATGIREVDFVSKVGDIANSDKVFGEDKGFRGIGRLCGLGYCKELRFTTSYLGENTKSMMVYDAQTMRKMLIEKEKHTVEDILTKIVSSKVEKCNENEHFFEVELFDINRENTDLLDEEKIKHYLSFVAPVPYINAFTFRNEIYKFAETLNFKIEEFKVLVNGNQIFKEYKTTLYEPLGSEKKPYDTLCGLEFKELRSSNGKLLAWLWFGLSRFEKVIPIASNEMRGLRMRQGNIQIGNENCLDRRHKEPRGNHYFVGEVFAVDNGLLPNSQRDYFNENQSRVDFERLIEEYFYETLYKLYHLANDVKSAYKKQIEVKKKVEQYNQKDEKGAFINNEERKKLAMGIEEAKERAIKEERTIKKVEDKFPTNSVEARVFTHIKNEYSSDCSLQDIEIPKSRREKTSDKPPSLTAQLENLSKKERKMIQKIYITIARVVSAETGNTELCEKIIGAIQEELKK